MNIRVLLVAAFSAAALSACSGTTNSLPNAPTGPVSGLSSSREEPAVYLAPEFGHLPQPGQHRLACPEVAGPFARCHALVRDDVVSDATNPAGYHPADLQSAYKLTTASKANGANQTVAIVDAYNDPDAAKDLAVYRSTFGLPACGTSNGCLKIVGESGTSKLPTNDGGWAEEISLDLDMVSAVCPKCKILLVEATSSSYADLGTSVDTAARLGATEISNSYGGGEYSGETSLDAYYKHAKVAVIASAGDSGYGVEYPAASKYVTAVGGTSLSRTSSSRGWEETVWTGTGSGCSAYESQPSWQTETSTVKSDPKACTKRIVGDVSSDADPNTGVSVYDSYAYDGYKGWLVFGGTSVSSPTIAAVYALAENAASIDYGAYPYSHTSALFDVTSGSNGGCGGTYLCTAKPHYDAPTGNGTPDGIAGF